MKKRTHCKLVIISIRVEVIRLVRIKAYKRKRFGKIEHVQSRFIHAMVLPDCPAQPLRQYNKRLHHRSRIGTMGQKYNWISLKFNDLHFAYAMLEISF